MSITQVWERLYIGDLADAEALAESNALGITTVISLCREEVRKRAAGINYLRFPFREDRPVPTGKLDGIIDAIWENIRGGTVLLHSRTGVSRAPILAAAWMHCCGYKNIDAALADIGRLRPIDPSPVSFTKIKEAL